MSVKTITITEEAYTRLSAIKEPRESFSNVVCRITAKNSLLELAGILTKKEADNFENNIKKLRTQMHERLSHKLK